MKMGEPVAASCKAWLGVIVTVAGIAGAITTYFWRAYKWVELKDEKDATHDTFAAPLNEIIEYNASQKRNSEMHCRLGNLSREWCEDQGFKWGSPHAAAEE